MKPDPRQLEFPFLKGMPLQRFHNPELDRIVEEVYKDVDALIKAQDFDLAFLRLLMKL